MNTGRSHGILWCRSACLLYNEGRFLSLRVLRWIEKEAFMNAAWGYAGMALAVASLPFKHWTNYEAQITRHTIEDAAWQGRTVLLSICGLTVKLPLPALERSPM